VYENSNYSSCKLNGSYSGTITHVKSLPKGDNPMSQNHTQYHHNYTTNHAAGKKPNLGRSLNFYFAGADPGGGGGKPVHPPPKIGKNMIFFA
jgi:hypothetical protein